MKAFNFRTLCTPVSLLSSSWRDERPKKYAANPATVAAAAENQVRTVSFDWKSREGELESQHVP